MVQLSITLSDLWPQFQGYDIFRHWISQKWHEIEPWLLQKVVCTIAWWHFQWPWRTPNPVFKVTTFLKSNISNTVRFTESFYRTLTGNDTKSIQWCHFHWPWVTSNWDFLKMNIVKTSPVKDKVIIAQEETNMWNGTVWWPCLASKCVAWVCQHQLSFL